MLLTVTHAYYSRTPTHSLTHPRRQALDAGVAILRRRLTLTPTLSLPLPLTKPSTPESPFYAIASPLPSGECSVMWKPAANSPRQRKLKLRAASSLGQPRPVGR